MSTTRSVYKVFRSILFTAVLVVVGLIVLTYVVISIPAVQKYVKDRAEKELTAFLGGKVEIGQLEIIPFNEARLYQVSIYEPEGKRCISVGRLGAGVNIWPLISSGRVEISYAELISLNAVIEQRAENGPLNIDFIIKAFQPKDKNKPPTRFDVVLRNVVIRKSSLTFNRTYKPKATPGQIDFNHLELSDLRADVAMPVLKNDNFTIDLRRLAFDEKSGLKVNNLSFLASVTPEEVKVNGLKITIGDSKITVSDQSLKIKGFDKIEESLKNASYYAKVDAAPIYPSDFACFYTPLSNIKDRIDFALEANGNKNKIDIEELQFKDLSSKSLINLRGIVNNPFDLKNLEGKIDKLQLDLSPDFIAQVLSMVKTIPEKTRQTISNLGYIKLDSDGKFNLNKNNASFIVDCHTDGGIVAADISIGWKSGNEIDAKFIIKAEDLNLKNLTSLDKLGFVSLNANGEISIRKEDIQGQLLAKIPYIDYDSRRYENIDIDARKIGNDIAANIAVDNAYLSLDADARCLLAGNASEWNLNADIKKFSPSAFLAGNNIPTSITGSVNAQLKGNSPDNLQGSIFVNNFDVQGSRNIHLAEASVTSEVTGNNRKFYFTSDYVDGEISGDFVPTQMFAMVKSLATQIVPSFVNPSPYVDCPGQYLDFTITPKMDKIADVVKLPFTPVVPLEIGGNINGNEKLASLYVDAPYLLQGKNKLIKNSRLDVSLKKDNPAEVNLTTTMPIKNHWANFKLDVAAIHDSANTRLSWVMEDNPSNNGEVGILINLDRDPFTRQLNISADVKNSSFILKDSKWNISQSKILYSAKNLIVDDLRISNNDQFVNINGRASDNPADLLNIDLAGIDLEYIFGTLNINYVDFGGIATGKAHVSNLFSKLPIATTDNLFVKDLSYNGCVLGDGQVSGRWDNEEKKVDISADISAPGNAWATVRGGVYVTRDSLSFDFKTHRINVDFMRPFVSGFTSKIRGKASGELKLFGTFSDIDMVGKAYADSVSMLVDYTNVTYTGSDTVYFRPGRISIPSMRLYDKYGNSCMFSGEVTHRYLHDAAFNFEVRDIEHLLVYDPPKSLDQNWYGHVYANGSASLRGEPGYVSLNMNLSTADNSSFTLVLDESETATNYSFLTFSDRRKELLEQVEVEESFEDRFIKKVNDDVRERPTRFAMDLALETTTGANMIIIMDPKAGDKISARGSGPLQIHYDTDTDKFSMYGKYTLANGTYNFSLQELILKNFLIREGSSISFNGDPLAGILDITAAYRVNANLADLDESFKSDPDLNRTSVPVEALLKVTGAIDAPEIKFDLDMPTVTSDVERRVRSLVSTEDMLNQQIIYLLALNRFYSPEYTSSSQGGELATVASSTISSQIQNILSSLTDKFSLAPSFKSDKDDFSEMEVDVALSSSLFDNRLLINGNLGYRDKSTSQTNFIGDFDIEYLLSRDGKLRLKAYNHFNDASYYLRSALTTQGIGIVYRKDFNDAFNFLKKLFRRRKPDEVPVPENNENQ